jgi:putative ABC transport system permease protein
MITNYIKIAFRNFSRNKSISSIKIIGLALGLAVTFFILIYISTETSYNDYNKNKERIFRVNQYNYTHGWGSSHTPFPMRDALVEGFPTIENATRITNLNNVNVEVRTSSFEVNQILCVDQSFFEIFTINKMIGDFSQFDHDINNVVLTESSALKFFGTIDIINKSFKFISGNAEFNLNVVAVIKDIPTTSTIKGDFICTIELGLNQVNKRMIWSNGRDRAPEFYRQNWSTSFLETYIMFKNKANTIDFDEKLKQLEADHLEDTTESNYYLQNVEDIYLYSKDIFGSDYLGDINSIYVFSAIAFLVLLIACINYILLSISQIITRSKEIGIRKIAGAKRTDLLKQISLESFILVIITIPLAFILIEQFRPVLEQIIKKQIILIYNWKFLLGFLSIICFVIFIPGLNIMYFLNKISPLSILKIDKKKPSYGFNLKKTLIVLQFIIFIVLVVVAIGIKKQIDFSTHNNLGFNPENKIVIQAKELVKAGKYSTLKTELLKNPQIKNISGAMWLPPSNSRMSFSHMDTTFSDEPINLEALFVDQDFIENFEIQLLEGKSLCEFGNNADRKILVNESSAEILGGNTIIGKNIWGGEVVGIVKDFRFHSVHEKIQPMLLVLGEFMVNEMVISYNVPITQEITDNLILDLHEFQEFIISEPELLEDKFKSLYEKELRLGILIGIFSFIAIFIASIGLLGITIFTTKQQTKNIAIRKVNGASMVVIWRLLMSGYIKLILIALILAVPIAYYLLNKWLQNFAYRTSIEWETFLIAGILAVFISMLTISWYSLKAARRNPVNSLRYE